MYGKNGSLIVDSAPSASPEFEGRGGEELNLELSNIIERLLQSSSAFKSDKLCLVPGKQVWIIYVDALVCILHKYSCDIFIRCFCRSWTLEEI